MNFSILNIQSTFVENTLNWLTVRHLGNLANATLIAMLLSSCGGGGGDAETVVVSQIPYIEKAYFRDRDATIDQLSGAIHMSIRNAQGEAFTENLDVSVYWLDQQARPVGDPILQLVLNHPYNVALPNNTSVPEGVNKLLLLINNEDPQLAKQAVVKFDDFKGNAEVSGSGGNEKEAWYYGVERPKILAYKSAAAGGTCQYDNGLVAVSDMNNRRDTNWESGVYSPGPNQVNEAAYPPYQFLCGESPINEYKAISDEIGVWTYSTLNDAMFYGTFVYDTFLKHLGEPPLEDKIRLRVHYGYEFIVDAFWDGTYASFSDGYPSQYSTASLDVIAHEVAHGVLSRVSALTLFPNQLSVDGRTLHEAFSDISGVLIKHEFQYDEAEHLWIHGAESHGATRRLDSIITESAAVASYFDYSEAGDNYYLRIGLITYPFYLLSNQWGVASAYQVFLHAAKTCWQADSTLPDAAKCIIESAGELGLPTQDVVTAFKAVKIKLFEEGVLSHFTHSTHGLQSEFTDNSQSTSVVSQWQWEFGDGSVSGEPNPVHQFATAGDYTVILKVLDQSGDQDTFQRIVTVTNE
ncbi:PKD domain-containing protein [Agarivorans sp. MS3-6]